MALKFTLGLDLSVKLGPDVGSLHSVKLSWSVGPNVEVEPWEGVPGRQEPIWL